MSESHFFLPLINEKQYNLLINVAETFLRENLSNLLLLVRDGLNSSVLFDDEQATTVLNEAAVLKQTISTLADKRLYISVADPWPVRFELPTEALYILRNRFHALAERYTKMAGTNINLTPNEWWSTATGIQPDDLNDLLVLIGSLEAIYAQVPNKYPCTTIMTGASAHRYS